jgi:uncharacterized membrane protein
MTHNLVKRILLFGALLGWCALLLLIRFALSGSLAFAFLAWNLVLAAVPAVAGWLFARAAERRNTRFVQLLWFAIWLAFLPNAPYVVTDFLHLAPSAPIPMWYDVALLASCTGTGLMLGYVSLADVQAVISQKFSSRLGWLLATAALLLSGFGIYLGRFLRWNSWDTLANPLQLFADIAKQLLDPLLRFQVIAVTLVYGIMLLLGYVALCGLRLSIHVPNGHPSSGTLRRSSHAPDAKHLS